MEFHAHKYALAGMLDVDGLSRNRNNYIVGYGEYMHSIP